MNIKTGDVVTLRDEPFAALFRVLAVSDDGHILTLQDGKYDTFDWAADTVALHWQLEASDE